MKRAGFSGIVFVLTLAAGCASTAGQDEMTLEEGAKMECRTIQQSGTILPKRICNNKATWAEIDERNKEQAKAFKEKIDGRYTPTPRDVGM